jgi:hypothetical protein
VFFYACAIDQYEVYLNTATDGSTSGQWWMLTNALPRGCDPNNSANWINWGTLRFEDGVHRVRLQVFKNGVNGGRIYDDWTYTLNRRRPDSPQLIHPSPDIWLNTLSVPFAWQSMSRTTSQRLLVSTNSDPSISPLVDQTFNNGSTSAYTANFATDYQSLYWRVISTNEIGPSNQTGHFGLDITEPSSAVTALSAVKYDTAFTVIWGGSDSRSGVRWYDIQYRDGNRLDSPWVDWMTHISKTSEVFIGQPGHTYYFQARSLDIAGNLEDWPGGNGDTYTVVNPDARPQTPWWNAAYSAKHNVSILNNDGLGLPAGYPIHLHFDNNSNPSSASLYAASQSAIKGDDFRIVYSNTTQLTRYMQAFQSDRIDIWFNLQAGLGPNPGSNGTSYQLYYGNPSAVNPPADPNTVFFPGNDANTVGLWRLFEGSGSTVNDASGHGYIGVASNMGWVQGKFGWAGVFNGTNALVNLGSSNAFNLNAFTAEAWVKFNGGWSETTFFRKEASDGSLIYDVQTDSQKPVLRLNGNSCNVIGNTIFQTGRWYHLAWVYDGATASVYVNGRFDKSSSCGSALRTGNTTLWMGGDGRYNNKYLSGYLQLARISNIARSSFPYGYFADILNEPTVALGAPVVPPVNGSADLAVLGMATYPYLNNGLLVQAIVKNQGSLSTGNGFYTDLYLDHVPTGATDYSGSLQFWINDPIAAGATVTLTTVITDLSSISGLNLPVRVPASETSGMLYAQVDSAGVVSETNNTNNIYASGAEVCLATPDTYEGDDTSATAQTINFGPSQLRNFTTQSDADWAKFTTQQDEAYRLRTLDLGVSADTYLYLYDTDGATLLASNDDYGGSLASEINWVAPTNGTYYLLVKHWNPNVSGCGTSYRLSIGAYELFMPLIGK